MRKRRKGTVLFRPVDGKAARISRKCPEELWCKIFNLDNNWDEANDATMWLLTADKGDIYESETGKYEIKVI